MTSGGDLFLTVCRCIAFCGLLLDRHRHLQFPISFVGWVLIPVTLGQITNFWWNKIIRKSIWVKWISSFNVKCFVCFMLAAFSRAFRKKAYVLCHCGSASPACSCIIGQLQQYTQFYEHPTPPKKPLCLATLSYNWNVEVERTVIQCSLHKVTASRLQCGMWLSSMRIVLSSVVWRSLWSASFLLHSIYNYGLWRNPIVLIVVLQWKLAPDVSKTLAQSP